MTVDDPRVASLPSFAAQPPADTTRAVTTWAEELQGRAGVHILARNDRRVPIRVTRLSIQACQNIMGGCRELTPDVVLEPGATRRIYTILPERTSEPWRYRWQAFAREERTASGGAGVNSEWVTPASTDGWVFAGNDSSELTLAGKCTYQPAPGTPSGRADSCETIPPATHMQQLEQRKLEISPGGEFRIRFDTRPGAVEISPAPAAMLGNSTDLRYRVPRVAGVYTYTIDASWGRRAATRSLITFIVR